MNRRGELSLRAVARDVGVAPSALYRYFGSRQDLVSAVARDAYNSAGNVMVETMSRNLELPPAQRALEVFATYRHWAMSNQPEFSLIFGTSLAELTPGEIESIEAMASFCAGPIDLYRAALDSGEIDEVAVTFKGDPGLVALAPKNAALIAPLTPEQVGVVISAWINITGFISFEIHGQLGWMLADTAATFHQHSLSVLRGMGYRGLDQ
jgi:AcrR family transcriptional regulator